MTYQIRVKRQSLEGIDSHKDLSNECLCKNKINTTKQDPCEYTYVVVVVSCSHIDLVSLVSLSEELDHNVLSEVTQCSQVVCGSRVREFQLQCACIVN